MILLAVSGLSLIGVLPHSTRRTTNRLPTKQENSHYATSYNHIESPYCTYMRILHAAFMTEILFYSPVPAVRFSGDKKMTLLVQWACLCVNQRVDYNLLFFENLRFQLTNTRLHPSLGSVVQL